MKFRYKYDSDSLLVFGHFWTQCTTSMRNKIRELEEYEQIADRRDPLLLWLAIERISQQGAQTTVENPWRKREEAMQRFNRIKQMTSESLSDFYQRFNDEVDTLKSLNIDILERPVREGDEAEEVAGILEEWQANIEKLLAMKFLFALDIRRYKQVLDDLANASESGRDEYPVTLSAAYRRAMN